MNDYRTLFGLFKQTMESIEIQQELADQLNDMIEYHLEGIKWCQPFQTGEIIICQPYDLEMFEHNKAKLESNGWVCDNDMQVWSHAGYISPKFTKGKCKIHWHIDPIYEGSTCKKTVIGYDKTPIYEVTCLEA